MKKVIKSAIKQSWDEYFSVTPTFFINAQESHEHGWKEGYEWILTELTMDGKISEETLKEYMDKLQ